MIQTPEKVLPQSNVENLERKIATLENRLQCISEIGDHLISANQANKLTKSQKPLINTMAEYSQSDAHTTVPDKNIDQMPGSKDSPIKPMMINSKQLHESVNRHIRNQNDRLGSARACDKKSLKNKSSAGQANVFRVPTSPPRRRRQDSGVPWKGDVTHVILPSPNVIRMKRCAARCTQSFQEHLLYKSDAESNTSCITDQSAVTDTDASLSTLDMALIHPSVNRVKPTHQANGMHIGRTTNHDQVLSGPKQSQSQLQSEVLGSE